MKIFYMNDEQKDITVRILDDTFDSVTCAHNPDHYIKLSPAEGKVFELVVPEGAVPYIKKWKDLVMISYVAKSVADSLPLHQPQTGLGSKDSP